MSELVTNKPLESGAAHVIDENLLFRGRWAEIVEFSYKDDNNQIRKWEGLHLSLIHISEPTRPY